jgi:glucose-6-phosphate isomerase
MKVKVIAQTGDNLNETAKDAVKEIKERAGKKGQFLNWIKVLPENQIKQLDHLYEMANEAKEGFDTLAILGIGGSRHTTESMMTMLGIKNVIFFSSVDPISFNRFIQPLNLARTKFMVVSKSGGTMETTTAYNKVAEILSHTFKTDRIENRIVAMTDASSEKSKLRKIVEEGKIALSGYVHDDVGGRFSIFDDATIFALAFAGIEKAEVKKMLEASIQAQDAFLNENVSENLALQLATFNVNAYKEGKRKHFIEYFSDAFMGTTLWEKQLKNESLKARISTDTNVGPGYLHYNAEADLDEDNKDSFFTFVNYENDDKVTNAILEGVVTAYSAQHPVSRIILDDLTLESIAHFVELKHFETIYTGNILRRELNISSSEETAMPEVLQPNVEKYKAEVRKAMAK